MTAMWMWCVCAGTAVSRHSTLFRVHSRHNIVTLSSTDTCTQPLVAITSHRAVVVWFPSQHDIDDLISMSAASTENVSGHCTVGTGHGVTVSRSVTL